MIEKVCMRIKLYKSSTKWFLKTLNLQLTNLKSIYSRTKGQPQGLVYNMVGYDSFKYHNEGTG